MSNIQSLLNLGSIIPGQVGNNQAEEKKDAELAQKPIAKKDKFSDKKDPKDAIQSAILNKYSALLVAVTSKDSEGVDKAKSDIAKLKSVYKEVTGERFVLPAEAVKKFEQILTSVTEKTIDVQNKLISAISKKDSDSIKDLLKQLSVLKLLNSELKKMLGKPEPEKIDYPQDVLDQRKKMSETLKAKISDLEKQLLKASTNRNEDYKSILLQLTTVKVMRATLLDFIPEDKPVSSGPMA